MTTASHNENVGVLLSLTPEDIRTIRHALRVLLQIHTRKEGYGAIRQALADLPDEECLAQRKGGEELHTLAFACREAGLWGDQAPRAAETVEGPPGERPAAKERVTLPISGLACGGGGALTIERALLAVPGIVRVYVNPATEMAYVEYWPAEVTREELVDVIEKLGYATLRTNRQVRERKKP